MKYLPLFLLVPFLGGCAAIDSVFEQMAVPVVNSYCASDEAGRSLIRAKANGILFPHNIKITCDGDEES